MAVFDFNKDGWMDLAFTHAGAPGISLWRNVLGKGLERVALPDFGWKQGWGVASIDYDNDGWLDLVAVEKARTAGRFASFETWAMWGGATSRKNYSLMA